MNHLEKFNVVELTNLALRVTNGGIPWLLRAAIAYTLFSVLEYPDAFEAGVNETFNSSL